MNRFVLMAFFVALTGASAFADGAATSPAPGTPMVGGAGSTSAVPTECSWYIKSLDPIVNLTDDQKNQITDIFTQRGKELDAANKASSETITANFKAVRDASNSGDQQAMAKATEAQLAAFIPIHDITTKYQAKLDKVLTNEQKAKYKDYKRVSFIKVVASPAELTDKQIKIVKTACISDDPHDDVKAIQEAIDNVLTPKQKAEANKTRTHMIIKAKFYAAKITDEQFTQIDAVLDQLVKDTSLTPSDLMDKASDKVTGLLTPEQKKAVESSPPNPWMQPAGPSSRMKGPGN